MPRNITDRELINYYTNVESNAKDPEHKAYARLMIDKITNRQSLNCKTNTSPYFSLETGKIYENIEEAAEELGRAVGSVYSNTKASGLKRIRL